MLFLNTISPAAYVVEEVHTPLYLLQTKLAVGVPVANHWLSAEIAKTPPVAELAVGLLSNTPDLDINGAVIV